MSKLLVVDDEQSICWGITRLGQSLGHEVSTASSAEEALEWVATHRPDAVVLDVRLPGMDGLTAINHFRRHLGAVPIIVITAYGDLQTAVTAVQQGAFDYLVKPFDLDQVQTVLDRALHPEPTKPPRGDETSQDLVGGLVGRSPAMQEVFKRIALAAASEASVLLTGESGTGKELASRAIHRFSRRAEQPFVAVNVASLSPSLAESELFGHIRGAFTGADDVRLGLLAQADGGTLFLDEVADIPLGTQVKLLRAIEYGEILPVGASEPVHVDFRLISATHQDLMAKVEAGEFRHDLFFRLCAFGIDLPPLRERRDDIVPLAEHFLKVLSPAPAGAPVAGAPSTGPMSVGMLSAGAAASRPRLSAALCDELQRREWLGNVRELCNAIEHAIVLSRGGILLPEHLPQPVASPRLSAGRDDNPQQIASLVSAWTAAQLSGHSSASELYTELLKLVEPPLLEEVLKHSGGQYVSAARRLGLHRSTLKKKLGQHGMRDPDGDEG